VFFQILLRQWILFIFTLPEDCHNPPTSAVVHQLNTVDATGKGFLFGLVARFIGAERMHNLAERLRLARDFGFKKALLLQVWTTRHDVIIDGQNTCAVATRLPRSSRDQACAGYEE
jgi:hypothetical protein